MATERGSRSSSHISTILSQGNASMWYRDDIPGSNTFDGLSSMIQRINSLDVCGNGMVTSDASQIGSEGGKRLRTSTPFPLLVTGEYSSMPHTKDWLDVIEKLPHHFSKDLELMESLSQCNPSPVGVMSRIVKEVLGPCDVVGLELYCGFSHGGSNVLDVAGGSCTLQKTSFLQVELEDAKRKACTLYGFVVKQILMKETIRLGTTNHGQLATKESLHRALLAICLDLVIETKRLVGYCYPWAADLVCTCPFDLLRVIESFLVVMDRELPVALKAHVRSINLLMLESHAWKITTKPDGLLDIIEAHVKEGGQWGKDMTVTRTGLVDIDDDTSIEKAVGRTKKTNAARLSSVATDRAASLSLIFFNLSSLAAKRVSQLCQVHLEMEDDFVSQVWTVAYQALVSKPTLLCNRHLDSILLCAVYSICKVQKDISKRIKFDRILRAYGNMCRKRSTGLGCQLINEHAATDNIELHLPGKRGGIIDFYNHVFIPEMKHFILDFRALEKQMAEMSTIKTIYDIQHLWNNTSGIVKETDLSTTAAQPRRSLLMPSNLHLQPLGTTNEYRRTLHIVQPLPFQWRYKEGVKHYSCLGYTKPGVYVTKMASHVEVEMNHSLPLTVTNPGGHIATAASINCENG